MYSRSKAHWGRSSPGTEGPWRKGSECFPRGPVWGTRFLPWDPWPAPLMSCSIDQANLATSWPDGSEICHPRCPDWRHWVIRITADLQGSLGPIRSLCNIHLLYIVAPPGQLVGLATLGCPVVHSTDTLPSHVKLASWLPLQKSMDAQILVNKHYMNGTAIHQHKLDWLILLKLM